MVGHQKRSQSFFMEAHIIWDIIAYNMKQVS